jgi:hypothetical protein
MEKIIGIVIASMMFANIGFAEMRLIEETNMKDKGGKNTIAVFATICVDGYKFIQNSNYGTSMVQFFEERDGKSLPTKC